LDPDLCAKQGRTGALAPKAARALQPESILWTSFPKGSSKIQTDLTRDQGWESLQALDLKRITLVSVNETWSAFSLRPYREGEKNSHSGKEFDMCRSIKQLRQAEIPATDEEIRAAALQFVRKVSGYRKPSRANEAAFERAVEEVAAATRKLLNEISVHYPVART
jgi:hypothetical protein